MTDKATVSDFEFRQHLESVEARFSEVGEDERAMSEEEAREIEILAAKDVEQRLEENHLGQRLLWPKLCHVQGNALLTSALFRSSRKRVWLDRKMVAAQGEYGFEFHGQTLNQFDELVWMELVQRARDASSFTVSPSLYSVARALGNKPGGTVLRQIEDSIVRMTGLVVTLVRTDEEKRSYGGSLIQSFEFEGRGARKTYTIALNPVWLKLILFEGYTQVDWAVHLSLPTGVATWLHRYTARHNASDAKPHRIGIGKLHLLMGMAVQTPLKEARRQVRRAMGLLQSGGVIKHWEIDGNDNLVFSKPLSEHQRAKAARAAVRKLTK